MYKMLNMVVVHCKFLISHCFHVCGCQYLVFSMWRTGKGLFAKREFAGGELLTEYVGELISDEEAGRREDINPRRCDYMFSFKHDSKFWW